MFGALVIIGGLCGSAVFGIYVEKTKKFKKAINLITILTVGFGVLLNFSFLIGQVRLTALLAFVTGFAMISMIPIGYVFGVELTYPVDEVFSTGIQLCCG